MLHPSQKQDFSTLPVRSRIHYISIKLEMLLSHWSKLRPLKLRLNCAFSSQKSHMSQSLKILSPQSSAMAPLISFQAFAPAFAPAWFAVSRSLMLTFLSILRTILFVHWGCSTAHNATVPKSVLFSCAWPSTCAGCAERLAFTVEACKNYTRNIYELKLQQKLRWCILGGWQKTTQPSSLTARISFRRGPI